MNARARACPGCGKPAVTAYRPFCSRRCADVDLARWFRGQYRLPGRDGEAALDPDAGLDGAPDTDSDQGGAR
ncbi:MAG: DNA gyrase inhibitor YacG [Pararhodobacter sp.]|nr:DNA gyrase inhibitor YacG [Pararhodobacter sp.]